MGKGKVEMEEPEEGGKSHIMEDQIGQGKFKFYFNSMGGH